MNELYPLKFKPIFKNLIWGGEKIHTILNKNTNSTNCGESWEISGVKGNISVVSEGFLKGNNLEELIEIYMGDLVGDKVYENNGTEFPLLIKFIDAKDKLSIQVHPDDELAYARSQSNGKTEMWYVMQNEKDAELIVGFNQKVDKESYLKHFNNNTLPEILNFEKVKKGDTYFIPAGKIHAIGAGILLTEIQQTSDATYRIFDWNRTDAQGNPRELHTELALEAIDFNYDNDHKIKTEAVKNKTTNLVDCSYFFTNILKFDKPIEKDYNLIDSFVIYIATEGSFQISYENKITKVQMGECVLIPAVLKNLILEPNGYAELIEVYVK